MVLFLFIFLLNY